MMRSQDIDIYNPDNYVVSVPHEQFRWLRQQCPVFWHRHPAGGGYWVVSRHADVLAVSRDHSRFSAQRGFVLVDDLPPDILAQAQGQLLGMDPPRHGPIRRAVITRFTSSMLAALEPQVRAITRTVMRRAAAQPECNFVKALAGELPTAVIGSMLDVPESMWPQLRQWSDLQTSASDPDIGGSPAEIQQASIDMGSYGYQLATERKGNNGDDLISTLLNTEIDGHQVSEMEFASLFVQITVAGNETTRGLIAGGMYALLQHPETYRLLESQPERIPLAVEEMLRWTCPLHYFRRTATCETEIAGQVIKENDKVVMLYSSANFDESVFQNPYSFDIDRTPNPHLAFGYGIHLCLGANLARMEARIFLEEFFRHFRGIELTGTVERIRSNLVNGLKTMPVRLLPR